MSRTDSVRVTTVVAVDPKTAFEVFTGDVDAWWRTGRRYRPHRREGGTMRFDPGAGGRLIEAYGDTGECYELGKILAWEPGERLAFEWRGTNFAPNQVTHVEVRFEPVPRGTRVTLVHRGWDAIPADHPARHGLGVGQAFQGMIGLWWADLLTSVRQHAGAPHAE